MITTAEPLNRLILELQSTDAYVQAQATYALGMLGEDGVQCLLELLKHPRHGVRMRASWALRIVGLPAIDTMLRALASGEMPLQQRAEAVRVLGAAGADRAVTPLIQCLTDDYIPLAHRAAVALGQIGNTRALYPLLTALRHPAPDLRYAVCDALGRLGCIEAIPALRECSTDMARTSWGRSVSVAARRACDTLEQQPPVQPVQTVHSG